MNWSPQQDAALLAVSKWIKNPQSQVFRLFGFAGTGKTTLAKHLAEQTDGEVLFGAFTGKAALVLRNKGCIGAKTIHSMIYRLDDEDARSPTFTLDHKSDVKTASLCIIDECSMVDEELGRDLLSFKTPILVLGDPEQLPPIKGAGFFTNQKPDIMLSEVHRQARDNPIIRLSMDVREGRGLQVGSYGESSVISRDEIDADTALEADQVLVGRNITRRNYNARLRHLRGYEGDIPHAGERLVCLRSNRAKGLLNGGMWSVASVGKTTPKDIKLSLTPEDVGGRKSTNVTVRREFFRGQEETIPWPERKASAEFDFGYALTVHKAQGSQWDNVILFDESRAFRDESRRWLYTGITRAAERITIVV